MVVGLRNAVRVFAQDNNGNGDLGRFAKDGLEGGFAFAPRQRVRSCPISKPVLSFNLFELLL
jgi:hypothetical protein